MQGKDWQCTIFRALFFYLRSLIRDCCRAVSAKRSCRRIRIPHQLSRCRCCGNIFSRAFFVREKMYPRHPLHLLRNKKPAVRDASAQTQRKNHPFVVVVMQSVFRTENFLAFKKVTRTTHHITSRFPVNSVKRAITHQRPIRSIRFHYCAFWGLFSTSSENS